MSKTKIKLNPSRISYATHAFSGASLHAYDQYVVALLQVKIAAACANLDAGVLDKSKTTKIVKACNTLIKKCNDAGVFYADIYQGGGGIGIHLNINDAVSELAGLSGDPKTHVSAGQSTADVCAAAMRIALWRMGQILLGELQSLNKSIATMTEKFKDRQFMARTCLQDAMPTSYATYFGAWRSATQRIHADIGELLDRLLIINLGGTVIGSGEGAHETYRRTVITHLCEVSTLRLSRRGDLFDAAQHADDLFHVSAALVSLGHVLGKIARDIRLLCSGPKAGFGDIAIPKVINGSAFFAQKNNPTIAETMLQATWLVEGKHASLNIANGHAELNLNVFEPMMGALCYESIVVMTRALSHFKNNCIDGITPIAKG